MVISSEDRIGSETLSVVMADPDLPRKTYVKAIMHVGDDNYYLDMLVSTIIKRDYLNNKSDYVEVKFQIPLGDFVYHIYPKRNDITMTLSFYSLGNLSTIEYFVTLDDYDENIKNNKYMSMKQDDLNRNYAQITAQCTSKIFMDLRSKFTQGTLKKHDVRDALIKFMSKEHKKSSLAANGTPGSMIIIDPNNTRVYDHVVIGNNTPLLDVPTVLQDGDYGIYNGGINVYLQNDDGVDNMYIFPKYRFDLLSYNKKKLYIIGVSSLTLTGVNNTYALEGDMVKIVVPKAEKMFDDDSDLISNGVGDISVNTDAILSRPFQIDDEKIKFKRDYLMERQQHKELESGVVKYENKGHTNNLYKNRDDVLKRDGMLIQFNWNFSDHKLIFPMMPVIYIYENDGKIYRHEGLVHQLATIIDNNKRMENSKLFVFFNREGDT